MPRRFASGKPSAASDRPLAFRFPPTLNPQGRHASLPLPHLRRAPRERHRPDGPPVRLVPSHPRPWRRAVHRPARPLRHDPMRRRSGFAGLQGGREAALGMGGADRRQGAPRAPPAPRIRTCRPARSRSTSARSRCWARRPNCRCRCSASRNIRRTCGCKYRFLDLRREKLHQNIMTRGAIVDSHAHAHEGAGLLRVPDADPDRLVARKARATSWCPRAFIPASSTRCRRRRSSTSSC